MSSAVDAFALDLPTDTSAPRLARTLVAERVGDHERLPDLLLCVSEVVTNAVLHARSAGEMRVRRTGDLLVVEVTDGDPQLPTRRQHDLEAPTGRGLHLLDALTKAWGTSPLDDGKVVWFEFDLSPAPSDEDADLVRRVELRGLSIPVHRRAGEHGEALRRELALVHHTTSPDAVLVHLRELGEEMVRLLGGRNDLTDERLRQALADDDATVDLVYEVPLAALPAFERLAVLVRELDQYCADRDLLTLVTPAEGVAYREWYLAEIIGQLRDQRAPVAWVDPPELTEHDHRPAPSATGATATLAITGDLDLEAAPALRDQVVQLLDDGATDLVVDLSDCTFLDSTGLSVLVTTHVRLQAEGGSLRLVGLTPQVRAVLDLSGLTDVMT